MSPPEAPKRRILVLFAHPAVGKSRVHRVLRARIRDLPGVTFNDLYENYPEFDIDVKREQALLTSHDVIVFQHPVYWYSTPAILKEWQDLVLEHGWAYGHGGTALKGKLFLNATSTGGPAEGYTREGFTGYTLQELFTPIRRTALLCGMRYLPPFVVHGTHRIQPDEIKKHAEDYRRILAALRDDTLRVIDEDPPPDRLNQAPENRAVPEEP